MGYPRELVGQTSVASTSNLDLFSVSNAAVFVDTDDTTHPVKIEGWVGDERVRMRLTIEQASQMAPLLRDAFQRALTTNLTALREDPDPALDRGRPVEASV